MPHREAGDRLRHMLEYSREAVQIARGRTRADLDADRLLNLAVVRLLELIGEAAARIPPEEQALHGEIPWAEIVSLRNRLAHGYDAIDLDVVWRIVEDDLPPLIEALERIVPPEGEG